jgi:hypothetical protein
VQSSSRRNELPFRQAVDLANALIKPDLWNVSCSLKERKNEVLYRLQSLTSNVTSGTENWTCDTTNLSLRMLTVLVSAMAVSTAISFGVTALPSPPHTLLNRPRLHFRTLPPSFPRTTALPVRPIKVL